MGTESDTIESRLVRVTTSKRLVGFHILVSNFQKGYVLKKIYGDTCKLKTRFFLRQVLLRVIFGVLLFVLLIYICEGVEF